MTVREVYECRKSSSSSFSIIIIIIITDNVGLLRDNK